MRQGGLLVSIGVLLAGACLLGAAGAGAHRPPQGCGPASAVTLRRDKMARVYELSAEGPSRGQPTYGCLFSTRHSWRLDLPGRWTFLNPQTVVLRAPWVAYAITSNGVDGSGSGISVKNLRTGAVTQGFPAITTPPEPGPERFRSVEKIVLQGNGNVAWIGQETSIISTEWSRRQVEIADSAGFAVVDESVGIEPKSLTLNGTTLTWSDSGETRIAQLF
jgi:hypothetical protein